MYYNFIKYNIKIIISLFLISCYKVAMARPIISGISDNQINIDTSFTGKRILLFGAKGEVGDIVITIKGPKKNYIVNKKDQTFGIWHNKNRLKFNNVYSYYSFFSTNKDLKNSNILKKLEIGQENINFEIDKPKNENHKIKFSMELLGNLTKNNLYSKNSDEISFMDETLFKVMIDFPENISAGDYLVEIYLIDEGKISAFQIIPIYVNQVGFNANIRIIAQNESLKYAFIAILLAVFAGFSANYIFSKLFK